MTPPEVVFYESDFVDRSRYKYASDQFSKALAEAIAAETERCARIAEARATAEGDYCDPLKIADLIRAKAG
jgi:regulator of protease activity HflC (stomatin/prohibitin superfamily)